MLNAESKAPITVAGDTPKQELLEPDEFQRIVQSIETADNKTALARMHELILEQGLNYLEQGGLLKTMQDNGWHYGHETFKALCQDGFGFNSGKAYWLIRIFEKVDEAKLTWADIENVGWSKMRVLCSKVNAQALPEWIDKAKDMTVLQLEASLKGEPGTDDEKLKMVGFYPNQWETINAAIEKLKHEHGHLDAPIENSEAIMGILTEYVGSPMSTPIPLPANATENSGGEIEDELAALVKKAGAEPTVKVLMKVYPTWTFEAYPPE